MTDGEKAKYLYRYLDARREMKVLADELEQVQSDACRVTPLLSGMPGGQSDGQALPRSVEQIIKARQELEAQINVCGATRREVVAAINQIADSRDHEIFRRRYLLGQGWEKISEDMHYSCKQIRRRHDRALQKMSLNVPKCP